MIHMLGKVTPPNNSEFVRFDKGASLLPLPPPGGCVCHSEKAPGATVYVQIPQHV